MRRRLTSEGTELDELLWDAAVHHLDELDTVEGYAVYYSAQPGDFYTISVMLQRSDLAREDLQNLVGHPSPVVRALGLICLARRDLVGNMDIIESFYADTAAVPYVPIGCSVGRITLADLAQQIVDDPGMLTYWDPARTDNRWRPENAN